MGLGDIGAGEILVLALVALFVFGPDRLPSIARQAGKAVRDLRGMVGGIRKDLSDELGVDEVDLRIPQVNPRALVKKHVLDGVDLDLGLDDRKPRRRGEPGTGGSAGARATDRTAAPPTAAPAAGAAETPPAPRPAYDPDAT